MNFGTFDVLADATTLALGSVRLTADTALNISSAIIILGVAVPSLYMAFRLDFGPFRILSLLLGSFLLLHGFYHLIAVFEADSPYIELVGEVVIEPLNWALLFGFTLYFLRRH